VPGQPKTPLLYKDKKTAKWSQLTAFAIKARTQCWLVLSLPGVQVRGDCTTTDTHIDMVKAEVKMSFREASLLCEWLMRHFFHNKTVRMFFTRAAMALSGWQ